jgi:hypothetical protein
VSLRNGHLEALIVIKIYGICTVHLDGSGYVFVAYLNGGRGSPRFSDEYALNQCLKSIEKGRRILRLLNPKIGISSFL